MADGTIQVGDVVSLKSGGVYMTVQSISGDDEQSAKCVWQDEKGQPYRQSFLLSSLKKDAE